MAKSMQSGRVHTDSDRGVVPKLHMPRIGYCRSLWGCEELQHLNQSMVGLKALPLALICIM